jgi:hypothetical protein
MFRVRFSDYKDIDGKLNVINLDLITIGQLNIIEKLYNELRNE